MTLAAGARLGPYEILSRLGAGGMGEVYRARDTRLGRDVAIKILPSSYSSDPDRLRRFEQEARAAGLLSHPNITAIYDVGTHEGSPYLVTELLEGETLRHRMAAGAMASRRATELALQAARGLAAAHDKGIVHRDLKPENIFVTRDGRLKILDFGLAKLIRPEPSGSAATEPGVVLGTFGYMSPEQVRGRSADARSDVFSLGAILYEMLTGQRAFHGDSAASTMSAILMREPPELSTTNRKVHPGLERIVRHCLEKSPEERFHSAHDLAFDLEALTSVSTPATAVVDLGWRRRWKKPVTAASLVLAGALAGFLARAGSSHAPASPAYERVTSRLGGAFAARFANDGHTIVYSSSSGGSPYRIFSTRPGAGEPVDLGLPDGDLLDVSSTGEMAISIGRRESGRGAGTLARVPLGGGAPRALLEGVTIADWSGDGTRIGIVRSVGGKTTLEFPPGHVLYETGAEIPFMRLSPGGESAFAEQGPDHRFSINLIDGSGRKITLSKDWLYVGGVAWTPDGSEIWFAGRRAAGKDALYAVDPSGHERLVRLEAGSLFLHDIADDGRVLLSDYLFSRGVAVLAPGESLERDLTWQDLPWVDAISADGRSVLFEEREQGGARTGALYLRRVDGSPPVHLGDGAGIGISPDGRWVLSQMEETGGQKRFLLLPTGQGLARAVEHRDVGTSPWGAFFPDGNRILFLAERGSGKAGDGLGLFSQAIGEGGVEAICPGGLFPGPVAISPDGRSVAAIGANDRIILCRLDGSTPRLLPGAGGNEIPIVWSSDGRSLYVYRRNELPARIVRIDVETGRREPWKEIAPADRTGLDRIDTVRMTPDGRAYAYGYTRILGSLQVVKNLR
ncbi:MAG TPA: protein kinase [Thermoanaerobaculia bacterium]|nr:protein kinase [Thermoanaerobaculia bacterium]